MAALTEATPRRTHGVYSWIQNYRVANGVTVYAGAFTGLPGASALTSNRGYLVLWQDESTIIWTGMAIGQSATNSLSTSNAVVGDTSASPVPEVSVECELDNQRRTVSPLPMQWWVIRVRLLFRKSPLNVAPLSWSRHL